MTRSAPAALITGSGRCGTGFVATVLRSSGLNAGHERWWTMDRSQEPGLDADVSWLGCFDHGYRGPVYAQVRDPRQSVPSLASAYGKHPWRLVYAQNVPLVGDPSLDAVRIWTAYTRHAVERAESWWRVEDLSAADLAPLGVDVSVALAETPQDVNTRPRREAFEWPADPCVDEAFSLARELGYDL